jgi:hypothetical protein
VTGDGPTRAPVDEARLRFLFGDVPEGVDLGDEDERLALLRADRPEPDGTWPHPRCGS